jgi:hypothetical protein
MALLVGIIVAEVGEDSHKHGGDDKVKKEAITAMRRFEWWERIQTIRRLIVASTFATLYCDTTRTNTK